MEKATYHGCNLKQSIHEEKTRGVLGRMHFYVRYIFIEIQRIAVEKGRFQSAMMEHAHQLQSMKTKTGKKRVFRFMFGDTPDASSIGSNLPRERHSKPLVYLLDTQEVIIKL